MLIYLPDYTDGIRSGRRGRILRESNRPSQAKLSTNTDEGFTFPQVHATETAKTMSVHPVGINEHEQNQLSFFLPVPRGIYNLVSAKQAEYSVHLCSRRTFKSFLPVVRAALLGRETPLCAQSFHDQRLYAPFHLPQTNNSIPPGRGNILEVFAPR